MPADFSHWLAADQARAASPGFVARIRRNGETFSVPIDDADSLVFAGIALASELHGRYPDGEYEVLDIVPRERLGELAASGRLSAAKVEGAGEPSDSHSQPTA